MADRDIEDVADRCDDPIRLSDVDEYLDSEKAMIRTIWGALQRKYAHEGTLHLPATQARFAREAEGVFAENGFVAKVPEFTLDCSDNPLDFNLYVIPKLQVFGRVTPVTEFDHDRQRHDVRSGVLDGVEGVIDPVSGELKESPKKQTIY